MKAREVIPGWPRGRSTTVSYENSKWKHVEIFPRRIICSSLFISDLLDLFYSGREEAIRIAKQRQIDEANFELDRLREVAYHQDQQRMTNRFIERGKPLVENISFAREEAADYYWRFAESGEDLVQLAERGARME